MANKMSTKTPVQMRMQGPAQMPVQIPDVSNVNFGKQAKANRSWGVRFLMMKGVCSALCFLAVTLASTLSFAAAGKSTPRSSEGRAFGALYQTDSIYSGATLQEKSLSQLVSEILPGSVVVISEQHTLLAHHDKQVLLLEELKRQGRRVSVGLEFLSYPFQDETNQYLAGQLSDADFQKQVGWGTIDFNMYKKQILFSLGAQGYTLAINAPRSLTNRIAKVGLAQLTPKELDLLPPNFQLGNSLYRERFVTVMQNHIPADALDRYFEAQSTWDDTMAWVASDFIQSHPDQVLVILVGDFHAQYGGGLPDRLRARGVSRLKVISQVQLGLGTPADDEAEMVPHARYGVRADEIWVSR